MFASPCGIVHLSRVSSAILLKIIIAVIRLEGVVVILHVIVAVPQFESHRLKLACSIGPVARSHWAVLLRSCLDGSTALHGSVGRGCGFLSLRRDFLKSNKGFVLVVPTSVSTSSSERAVLVAVFKEAHLTYFAYARPAFMFVLCTRFPVEKVKLNSHITRGSIPVIVPIFVRRLLIAAFEEAKAFRHAT
jgi:hypothetical protein